MTDKERSQFQWWRITKERHALQLYKGASAGNPWSPGDACKLVYSSFPCVLFWPNFRWSRTQSHRMHLDGLAPSMSWRCMCDWTLCVSAFVYRTPCTELWSPFLRIFVKWQTCSPLHRNKGQWWGLSAAPQAAMLLTLSAHCLLSKRPRPKIDAIGHFCKDKWRSLGGTETKWQWVLLSSSCSNPGVVVWTKLPRTFFSPYHSLSCVRYFVEIWWLNDTRSFSEIFACNICAEYRT